MCIVCSDDVIYCIWACKVLFNYREYYPVSVFLAYFTLNPCLFYRFPHTLDVELEQEFGLLCFLVELTLVS
jgi:hypothetical protein